MHKFIVVIGFVILALTLVAATNGTGSNTAGSLAGAANGVLSQAVTDIETVN